MIKDKTYDLSGHLSDYKNDTTNLFSLIDITDKIRAELRAELEKTSKTSKLKREILELKIEIERQRCLKYFNLIDIADMKLEKQNTVPSPETNEIDTVPNDQTNAVQIDQTSAVQDTTPKIYNEVRGLKMIFNKGGNGGVSTKVSIPISYSRTIGVTEDSRDIEIELVNDSYITIRKKRLK